VVFGFYSDILCDGVQRVVFAALWNLHQDHHVPHQKVFERNDAFAVVFAVPSFFSLLFGTLYGYPLFEAFGYGIMAYGFAYFFVHEVIIHRRIKFFRGRGFYFLGLIMAHREHHVNQGKEGAANFGMLWVHPKYFKKAWQHRRAASSQHRRVST
jgi:beta-carotene 3-hydroxylase